MAVLLCYALRSCSSGRCWRLGCAGKAAVYTATAGVKPSQILPVTLDVGCDTDSIREDPLYIGLPQRRVRGDAYDELVDETVTALRARYGPALLVHWEDFKPANAYRLLAKYRGQARASPVPSSWFLYKSASPESGRRADRLTHERSAQYVTCSAAFCYDST